MKNILKFFDIFLYVKTFFGSTVFFRKRKKIMRKNEVPIFLIFLFIELSTNQKKSKENRSRLFASCTNNMPRPNSPSSIRPRSKHQDRYPTTQHSSQSATDGNILLRLHHSNHGKSIALSPRSLLRTNPDVQESR